MYGPYRKIFRVSQIYTERRICELVSSGLGPHPGAEVPPYLYNTWHHQLYPASVSFSVGYENGYHLEALIMPY